MFKKLSLQDFRARNPNRGVMGGDRLKGALQETVTKSAWKKPEGTKELEEEGGRAAGE